MVLLHIIWSQRYHRVDFVIQTYVQINEMSSISCGLILYESDLGLTTHQIAMLILRGPYLMPWCRLSRCLIPTFRDVCLYMTKLRGYAACDVLGSIGIAWIGVISWLWCVPEVECNFDVEAGGASRNQEKERMDGVGLLWNCAGNFETCVSAIFGWKKLDLLGTLLPDE